MTTTLRDFMTDLDLASGLNIGEYIVGVKHEIDGKPVISLDFEVVGGGAGEDRSARVLPSADGRGVNGRKIVVIDVTRR